MTALELSLLGTGTGVAVMTISWLFAVRRDFYSLVDVSWSYGIGLIGISYGILGSGHLERRVLVSLLVAAWSLRLGTHLALRLAKKYPEEDRRYAKIKAPWGAKAGSRFFWFFQLQALSQPLLCLPIAFAAQSSHPIGAADLAGLAILIAGIAGESLADAQLKRFKTDRPGAVCDAGLWKYSRHPNYFFEWVIWCGFAILGISGGWSALVSPLIMFLLLNFVTGVPPAEEQSLASKGDLYRDYQRRTSRFFPWRTK